MAKDRDPGDAVPAGVAPTSKVPLSDADKRVRENLERIGHDRPSLDLPEDSAGLDERPAAG